MKVKNEDEDFNDRYGELLDGYRIKGRTDSLRWLMFTPFMFVFKRVIFTVSCFFLMEVISLQTYLFYSVTMVSLLFTIIVKPSESMKQNFLEGMNDFVTLFLLLLILVFTDWVTDPYIRYRAGWGVIGLSTFAIAVHVFLMLRAEYTALKQKLKQRKLAKASKENAEAKKARTEKSHSSRQLLQ